MKRFTAAALLLLALGCASSDSQNARGLQPEIDFIQLVGPADLQYPSGRIQVQFGLRINNVSAEPITLRRIQLIPVGGDVGPYEVRAETYYFEKQIAPSQRELVDWWAHAYALGDQFASDANAPVGVRAIVYFESPQGPFRQILLKNFSQFGTGPR